MSYREKGKSRKNVYATSLQFNFGICGHLPLIALSCIVKYLKLTAWAPSAWELLNVTLIVPYDTNSDDWALLQ